MKKLAIISSYCDNQEKKETLINNVQTLKNNGLDVLVVSPLPIQVDCDFLFITKENPILGPGEKACSYWWILEYENHQIRLNQHYNDYGWASLYQIKKGLQIANTFNYDIFYLLIYDLIINDDIINEINLNKTNIVFPRRDHNNNFISPSTFNFSIFEKNMLTQIIEKINYDEYISVYGFAEDFIDKWSDELNLERSKLIVEDSIDNHLDFVRFNYSRTEQYKLFIGNDDNRKIAVFIYDLNTSIILNINDKEYFLDKNQNLISTDLPEKEIFNITITHKKELLDYSDIFNKIVWNEIQRL